MSICQSRNLSTCDASHSFFFALYAVVFVVGFGLGFVYDDRMDTLRKRHIHDTEATSLENLYSAIALEFAARVGERYMRLNGQGGVEAGLGDDALKLYSSHFEVCLGCAFGVPWVCLGCA